MRKFIVYSQNASTAPVIRDLKSAGRIDILLHSIISALFASNEFRLDVELHLILMGPPNAPRHITLRYSEENSISKKNLKKIIEVALRKYRDNKTTEVHPGIFIDNKTIEILLKEFEKEEVFVLDFAGTHIKDYKKNQLENGVFILGDHDGFEKKVKKYLKKSCNRLSLGDQIYFTSQAITIINYELDNLN